MELEILVRKAKRGDKDAFLELMLSHKEYLYRTAYLYTRSRNGTPRNGRRRKRFPGKKKWIYTRP